MGGLLVQQVRHLDSRVVELVLLIADIADAGARDLVDAAHILGKFRLIRQADLAADDDAVGGGEGFASDARLGLFGQKRIQNSVGNAVADLIGVALRNGFGGEQVIISGHCVKVLHWKRSPRQEAVVGRIAL